MERAQIERYIVSIGVPEFQQKSLFTSFNSRKEMEDPSGATSEKTRCLGQDNNQDSKKSSFYFATIPKELGDLVFNLFVGVPETAEVIIKPAVEENIPANLREYFSKWNDWVAAREDYERHARQRARLMIYAILPKMR